MIVPSKDKQEVLAQDERQGAIAGMRARFLVISEQIASELVALSKCAAQMPSPARAAALSAAAQIAKTQERLCDETARAPMALELRLGLMQDLLQGLLHLGGIAKQQAPRGLDPEVIVRSQVARSQIALLTRLMQDQQGRVSDDTVYAQARLADAQIPDEASVAAGSRRQTKRVARARQSAYTLVKNMASLSLGLVAAVGAGLLVAYATFPSANTQSESAGKRLDLPPPNMVAATPLPVPLADSPARTEPSPSVAPAAPGAFTSALMEPSPAQLPFNSQGPHTQLPPLLESASAAAGPSGQNRQSPTPATGSGPVDAAADERFVPVVFTHKDQATAARAFADLKQQYPTLLKRRQSEVQPVEVNNKGTWHRLVVLPTGSRQQADALCAQLTAAGYDRCWVKPY